MFLSTFCLFFIILTFYRFHWAILLAIGLMPITRFPGMGEYIEPPKYLLLILIFLSWIIEKILSRAQNEWAFVKENPYNVIIILFSLLIFITSFSSMGSQLTLKAVITHFITFAYLYLFLDIFRSEYYVKRAIYIIILSAVFVSIIAILQYLVVQFEILPGLQRFILPPVQRQFISSGYGFETPFSLGGYRSIGTFYHFNMLSIYLSMIFPFVVSLLFYIKERSKRTALAIFAIMIIGGIFCSGSRGGFLNLLFACSVLFIFYRKRIPVKLVLIFLIGVILFVVVFYRNLILYFRFTEGVSFRDIIWENAFEMIKNNPFVGSGLGTFSTNYIHNFGFPSLIDFENVLNEITVVGSSESLIGFTAHNLFLNYAVEMGIFAAILMLCWYILYIKKAFKVLFKENTYNFSYMVFIGATASIIGNFAHSFFEASINFNDLAIGIIFILILSMGINSLSKFCQVGHEQK